MVALITLAEAKAHLRVDFADDDALIDVLIQAASEAVLDYLKGIGSEDFFNGSVVVSEVPARVRLATGHLTKFYYDDHVDKGSLSFADLGELPPPVVALLYRMRDPAIC